MAARIDNLFLVNAPAGSGKTTLIQTMVTKFLASDPRHQLLCITYTNRAKDELTQHIDSPRVLIGTIHSFLQSFMQQYFKHTELLDVYYEMFDQKIINRINNPKNDSERKSNERYCEKYGDITYDMIKKNIKELSYNESSFTSLYYGGLSHDDLIKFSYMVFSRYPILQRCLAAKYQTIFIDEYQDAFAEVLRLFYISVQNTTTKLYLFGDRMQQIYKNYDGSFEDELSCFDQSIQLQTNYRSIPVIVGLLNNIYNDTTNNQKSSEEMIKHQSEQKPIAIFCNDMQTELEVFKANEQTALVLRLFNKDRFHEIGSGEIFEKFCKMDAYAYHKQYSAVDVLTTEFPDNPDPLMKLLFFLEEIHWDHLLERYGLVIQKLRAEIGMIIPESCIISSHQEKLDFHAKVKGLFCLVQDDKQTIRDILTYLRDQDIIQAKYYEEVIHTTDYEHVWDVSFNEILKIKSYLRDPTVSTQHGVKGESHESVIFVAEDSSYNPVVKMYKFFDIWSKADITLEGLNKLYYSYTNNLKIILQHIGITKIDDLRKESFNEHKEYLINQAHSIVGQYEKDQIFENILLMSYSNFLQNPLVGTAKNCFKESTLYGIVSAYKLFYVGCSRARKDLKVLIDQTAIIGEKVILKEKLEKLGFNVRNQIEGK